MNEDMAARFMNLERSVDELKASNRRIVAMLLRLEAKVDGMATRDALAMLESRVMKRFDGFAKLFEDMRFRWAVHADTLVQHDRRLKRLEARRA